MFYKGGVINPLKVELIMGNSMGIAIALALVTSLMSICAAGQSTEIVLHAFKGGSDGGHPTSGLAFDPAGNLYGVTTKGGNQNCGDYSNGCGTVFRLTLSGSGKWVEEQLGIVPGGDAGGDPVNIVSDTSGNLFITEFNHGVHGEGQIAELSPDGHGGWTKSLVHAFAGLDGEYPNGVTLDSAGNLYGMTQGNSSTGDYGLVFKISKNSSGHWVDQTLYKFNSDGGGIPDDATVALDAAGNLYGTLYDGGNSMACNFYPACGVVFQLSPSAGGGVNETVLHNFTGEADGNFPSGNLIVDAAGNVYGTTLLGGPSNNGVVFELSPQAGGQWQESTLYAFTGEADGSEPNGIAFGADGNIYGSTGTSIFELTPNGNGGWNESTLYSTLIGGTTGGNGFMGGVVFDSSGNLYGTAQYGGLNNCKHPSGGCGVVYEIQQ